MKESQAKTVLKIAGWYNIAGGLAAIALFRPVFKMLYDINYQKADHELLLMNHILVFGFVVIIGIGLIQAAKDPAKNKAIIFVSATGKLFAFLTWLGSYVKGTGTFIMVLGGLTDVLFALLFLLILKLYSV